MRGFMREGQSPAPSIPLSFGKVSRAAAAGDVTSPDVGTLMSFSTSFEPFACNVYSYSQTLTAGGSSVKAWAGLGWAP